MGVLSGLVLWLRGMFRPVLWSPAIRRGLSAGSTLSGMVISFPHTRI